MIGRKEEELRLISASLSELCSTRSFWLGVLLEHRHGSEASRQAHETHTFQIRLVMNKDSPRELGAWRSGP